MRDKQIAVGVNAGDGFPGDKYPNLFTVSGTPARGHAPEEVQTEIHAQLEKLKTEDATDDELAKVKTRVKARLKSPCRTRVRRAQLRRRARRRW